MKQSHFSQNPQVTDRFFPLLALLEEEAERRVCKSLLETIAQLHRLQKAVWQDSYLKLTQALYDQSFDSLQDSLNFVFKEQAEKKEEAKRYLDAISLAVYQWIVLRETGKI